MDSELATSDKLNPRPDRGTALWLIAILIAAMLFLFYGPNEQFEIATFTALIAIPACLGGLVSHAMDPAGEKSPMGCFVWPTTFFFGLLAFALVVLREGAVCIAMVLPLWIPAALTGALIQYLNARRRRNREDRSNQINAYGWMTLPMLLLAWDQSHPVEWQDAKVERTVVIDALPSEVWEHVKSIPEIAPQEGIGNFTHDVVGIPRPTGAILTKRDGKLVRKARWGNSIRFEEVVQAFVPEHRIEWAFEFPDKSIQQNTDRHISPSGHFLRVTKGSYLVEPLQGGRTKLTLTTRYRMKVRMAGYFGWWGERMLGDIQNNILAIVKARAR